jgi:hypothetical protein
MALYRITNRSRTSKVFLPVHPSIGLDPGEVRDLYIPVSVVDESETLKTMVNAGLISLVASNDPDTSDDIEVLPANASRSLGTFSAIADADEVPDSQKTTGMLVYAEESQSFYKLEDDGTTWSRTLTAWDPSLRAVYVNHDSGDNDAAGTVGDPVATIKEAMNRLMPAHIGPQYWAIDDPRYIYVQESASTIKEAIAKPLHHGPGPLVIQGAEEVLHTVVNNGFSAISGFLVRQRLAFTGAALTPNTLQNNAFVKLQDPAGEGIPVENDEMYEDFPIVDNAAGTLDTTSILPGSASGFYWGTGQTCDVVAPLNTISAPDGTAFVFTPSCFVHNAGGPLIVRGFDIEPAANVSGEILAFDSGPGNHASGSSTSFHRCIIRGGQAEGFYRHTAGGGSIGFFSCILSNPTISTRPRGFTATRPAAGVLASSAVF